MAPTTSTSTISLLLLLLLVAGTALPAVVLPRPPSSPNYIPREYNAAEALAASAKGYVEKAMYQQQNTNVEKPDTRDYRFLEIEVRDGDNIDSLDFHGLVQAVLNTQRRHASLIDPNDDVEVDDNASTAERQRNLSYPHPEVIPHSLFGVRDVGLGPSQRLFEPTLDGRHYLQSVSSSDKNLGDEKMYYLKSGRPKVYVNFRGRTGNFRQDGADSKVTVRLEPSAFLRATQPYQMEKRTKSSKSPPKKYDSRLHGSTSSLQDDYTSSSGGSMSSTSTTENTMVTSSELPKQIPAPPSRIPSRSPIVHTTPVQRYVTAGARRTDILPGYGFQDA